MRTDLALAGRGVHELFMGEDTDEAEAAAWNFAEVMHLTREWLTRR